MKRLMVALAVILLFATALTACGKKDQDKAKDDTATTDSVSSSAVGAAKSPTELPFATTVVTETTAKGGTLEKDRDGNVIEIDASDEIVSIKSADGESLDIPGYLDTHYFVSSSGKEFGNTALMKDQSEKSAAQSGASSNSADKSGDGSQEKKDAPDDAAPKVLATEKYEMPIL